MGRRKGLNQTHKTFRLNNELLGYWDMQLNKNNMINEAIKMYREYQLSRVSEIIKQHQTKPV